MLDADLEDAAAAMPTDSSASAAKPALADGRRDLRVADRDHLVYELCVGRSQVVEGDAVAGFPGGEPRQLARVERRQREPDRRHERPRVAGPAELLEDHRLVDQTEAGPARRLGDRDPGPAELGQLGPFRAIPLGGLGVTLGEITPYVAFNISCSSLRANCISVTSAVRAPARR